MGVYIKGIEMPERSDYSKRYDTPETFEFNGAIIVYPDGKSALRVFWGRCKGEYEINAIPPHGRLIDADALIKELWWQRRNYQMLDDTQTVDKIMHGLFRAEQLVNDAPTIIEAEEEDDG